MVRLHLVACLALFLAVAYAAYADWPDITTESGTWPDELTGGGAPPIGPPANVIYGPLDFEASDAACTGIGVTNNDGDTDCACADGTGACALEGSFSYRNNADDNGQGVLQWRTVFPAQGGTGLLLMDALVDQEVLMTQTTAHGLMRFISGNSQRVFVSADGDGGAGGTLGFQCRNLSGGVGAFVTADIGISPAKVRLGVGFDGPGCDALGLGDVDVGNDGNCCGVWSNPVTDDYGEIRRAVSDAAFNSNTINGIWLGVNLVETPGAGTWVWDDVAVCDEVPPVGGKCGDLP